MATFLTMKLSGAEFEEAIKRCFGWPHSDGIGSDFVLAGKLAEARSRTIGTDGDSPRITVSALKMSTSDYLLAAHYDIEGRLVRALCVPIPAIEALYNQYKQRNGRAHLPWHKLAAKAWDLTKWLS